MSGTIDVVASEVFTSQVKHAYQGASMLRGTVRRKNGVVGKTVHFNYLGALIAIPRINRSPVPSAGAQWQMPEAQLKDWICGEYTDVFEDIKTNVSERSALARAIALALGRQDDEAVLSSVSNATADTPGGVPVEVDIGGTFSLAEADAGTNKRPSYMVGNVRGVFLNHDVSPMSQCTLVLPAVWYRWFAADDAFANRFYGRTNVTRTGMLPLNMHGIECIFLADRRQTAVKESDLGPGWSSAGGVGWAYDEMAVGLAYGMNPSVRIAWVDDRLSWLVVGTLSVGGVAIDGKGIIKVSNGPAA